MVLEALIESRLHNGTEALRLSVSGDAHEPFIDAVIRAHRALDPTLTESECRLRSGTEEANYEIEYIEDDDGFRFPASIRLPEDATFETVAAFFGPDLTDSSPRLRLEKIGGRGGDNYYVATVAIDAVRAVAEIYGIYVGGRQLVKYATRWYHRVPVDAVKRWTNTGEPDETLIEWVRMTNPVEWTPSVLATLLNVDVARCPELLAAAGYHPVTSSGEYWIRD
ncbi:hypothetical protein [Agromyces kandeliae]|uniref:Uncharacterized protein n=1 Tax=Agromyces kandeliae TaxID=2666141 RepID=A0A6L5QZS1_9MICO|nr:hypothetical protein [Agromyces kandeliae]MRX42347.1 hypothetical protein [Agromyces kandeliae]